MTVMIAVRVTHRLRTVNTDIEMSFWSHDTNGDTLHQIDILHQIDAVITNLGHQKKIMEQNQVHEKEVIITDPVLQMNMI